jgi:RNA polymerase sigma factor (sigma-70 family)
VPEDVELLDAWRQGDREAGDALLGRYFDAVCRFFRGKLGDDVEDLIQRTFLDCVESRERIREGGFRVYLFTVARNRLFDHLRARRRVEHVDISLQSMADLGTSPSSKLARNEREQLLVLALRRIPLDQQIMLELAYWEGLRGKEIADVLGIAENTVRSRLSRARDALRDQLAALAASPELCDQTLESFDLQLRRGAEVE